MNQDIYERLRKISERLKKEYHAEKVILYGSYAKGEETEESDIDLFIIASTSERFFERMARVRTLVRDLCYKIPLSPIVLTTDEVKVRLERGDQFIEQIMKNGLYL
ncbi:MAG: nucleotidyltransferase domain-containing protein [Thermodesulfobacteriota bacterium]|nr:nucleotidyltransferase domain-containing protein [Thermodesulfobacteriota bacterium]